MADFKVQRGSSTILNTESTITITAGVDYDAPAAATAAFVRITNAAKCGVLSSGDAIPLDQWTCWIADADPITTSITFTRYDTTTDLEVYWEIIEYIGDVGGSNEIIVRAVEAVVSAGATADTAAVSGVVTDADIAVILTGQGNDEGAAPAQTNNLACTTEWQVGDQEGRATRTDSADNITVSMAVVEFTGANWAVQRVTHSYTLAGSTETETITTVGAIGKAFVHPQLRTGSAGLDEFGQEVWLSAATTLSFKLIASADVDHESVVWVINNTQAGGTVDMNVQRASGSWGGGGDVTTTETITTVVMAETSLWGLGAYVGGTGTACERAAIGFQLTNATTVTIVGINNQLVKTYRLEAVTWPTETARVAGTYYMRADGTAAHRQGATSALLAATSMSTIRHNTETFIAGDEIVLSDAGGVYGSQVEAPSGGSAVADVLYSADGTPIINGADALVAAIYKWTASGSGTNEYHVELSGGGDPSLVEPKQIFMDDIRSAIGTVGSLADHEWDWGDNDALGYNTVYLRDNTGDPDASGVEIDASQRDYGFTSVGNSYITVDGITAQRANVSGVHLQSHAKKDQTVQNCTGRECWNNGIRLEVTGDTNPILIDTCTVYDNGGTGILVSSAFSTCTITGCTAYRNCSRPATDANFTAGIRTFSEDGARADDITITDCTSYSNGESGEEDERGFGIWADTPGSNCVIEKTLTYDNQKAGIHFEWGGVSTTGQRVSYNIAHDNEAGGIMLFRNCHDAVVYNNTCYNNGSTFGNIAIRGEFPEADNDGMVDNLIKNNIMWTAVSAKVFFAWLGGENDGTKGSGNVYSNNIIGPEDTGFIGWGVGVAYDTLAAWETASSQSDNIASDPLFVDPDNDNFRLQLKSPCCKAGVDVGLSYDHDGRFLAATPSIGAFEGPAQGSMTGRRRRLNRR